jgi:hypothetical protein
MVRIITTTRQKGMFIKFNCQIKYFSTIKQVFKIKAKRIKNLLYYYFIHHKLNLTQIRPSWTHDSWTRSTVPVVHFNSVFKCCDSGPIRQTSQGPTYSVRHALTASSRAAKATGDPLRLKSLTAGLPGAQTAAKCRCTLRYLHITMPVAQKIQVIALSSEDYVCSIRQARVCCPF